MEMKIDFACERIHVGSLSTGDSLKQWAFKAAEEMRHLLATVRPKRWKHTEHAPAILNETSNSFPDQLLQARELLEQAISSSHQAVESIATHFQILAAMSGEVCELT